MLKGKFLQGLFLFLAAGLFVYGVAELLILRFQKGDVYPSYSSFRSDPMGSRAFYEGLRLVTGVESVRNVGPLSQRSGLSEATLFLFGLQKDDFSAMEQASVKVLEAAALGGGRIVISFAPVRSPSEETSKEVEKEECPPDGPDHVRGERQGFPGEDNVRLADRWGVKVELSREKEEKASLEAPEQDLPSSLAWHSALVFEPSDSAWNAVYVRAGKPVLMERSYGKGSILLSSDSFFISNEAMKNDRHPRLLSWLCGPHRQIIFDETHLGISRSPGIATLLRKYGLAPFFVSLLALALLAIWKQSARFIPPYEDHEQVAVDPGKDTSAGLTNLLRGNIPREYVLHSCLEEWKRSFTHGKQNRSSLLPRMEQIIARDRARPRKNRNPVEVYRKISALVKTK